MAAPVVLDIDGAVGSLPGELRLPLAEAQEVLRFGCTRRMLARHWARVAPCLPAAHGPVFIGSGDFHHLSLPLIARAAARHPGLHVVVLDNHPDNMRYPFGVHCGSWVSHVAALPGVAGVDVAGITSADIGTWHAWENRLAPLWRGRLRYWHLQRPRGPDTRWARRAGLGGAFTAGADADALLGMLLPALQRQAGPVYLSIDKDVFAPAVVHTNWDQGVFERRHAEAVIAALAGRLVGSDVTGEVSFWRYRSAWKRLLSHADGQAAPADASALAAWQAGQHTLNLALLPQLLGAAAG